MTRSGETTTWVSLGHRLLVLSALVVSMAGPGEDCIAQSAISLCEGVGCSASDIRFQGDSAAADFGFSASAGRLNGDVFADLAIGAPDDARVFIFFGSLGVVYDDIDIDEDTTARSVSTDVANVVLEGIPGSKLGFSVFIGSQGDLILGAPGEGRAYVVPAGDLANCLTTPCDIADVALPPLSAGGLADDFGYSVALANVAGSSAEEMLVGAPRAENGRGVVYVFSAVLSTSAAVEPEGAAVLRPGRRHSVRERRTVRAGRDAASKSQPGQPMSVSRIVGAVPGAAQPPEGLGEFLAVGRFFAGSVLDQVAIGAAGPSTIVEGDPAQPGRVYVVQPAGTEIVLPGAEADEVWCVDGESDKDLFGFALAGGDLDGDGESELAVGAPFAERPGVDPPSDGLNAGAVYLFHGSEVEPILSASRTCEQVGSLLSLPAGSVQALYGLRKWDQMGFSVAFGDVDDEGAGPSEKADELVVAARWQDNGASPAGPNGLDQGTVQVYRGSDVDFCSGVGCGFGGAFHTIQGGDFGCSVADCAVDGPGEIKRSDEIGFALALGDFNGDDRYDDLAITSVTLEHVYVVSLTNTDNPGSAPDDGHEPDAFRDIRDDDDDGDGYLDVDEDANRDGVLDLGAAESDPLIADRDVTVDFDHEVDPEILDCDSQIEVRVDVTNRSRRLLLLDPELRITLPNGQFTYSDGSTEIVREGSVTPVDDELGLDPFPFQDYRSITQDGLPRVDDPLQPTPEGTQPGDASRIQVRFLLEATLQAATVNLDSIETLVRIPGGEKPELPFLQGVSTLAFPNDDEVGVLLLRPDLIVSKASADVDGPPYLDPLDEIEYTILVSNTGPSANTAARQIEVVDAIPTLIPVKSTYVPGSIRLNGGVLSDGIDADQGEFVVASNSVRVRVPSLALNAQAEIRFRVRVVETVPDNTTITNSATVAELCQAPPPLATNTTANLVRALPSLVLTKTGTLNAAVVAPPLVANAGDTISYAFSVQNTGNVRVTGITVTDPLLPTLVCTIAQLLPGATAACAATNNVRTLTQANVDAGFVTNTATAAGTAPAGTNVNIMDAETVLLPAAAQLQLTKTGTLNAAVVAPPLVANAGDTISYAFSVQNTGNVTVTSIDVTDPLLPALVCAIGTLAPGATAVCVATNNVYTLTQANVDAGQVANTATATGQDPGANDVTDTDAKMVPLPAAPQLTLTKTGTLNAAVVAPPLVANAGDTISYAFSVQNTGNVTVTSIDVTDPLLPALVCAIGTLAPGATAACVATNNVYTLTQANVDAGQVANTATATGQDPGANDVTDTDAKMVPLPAAPQLTLTKTGTLNAAVVAPPLVANAGDTISYAFSVQNTGNVTVTSIDVTDPLLPALVCAIGTLAPGATAVCVATNNVYTLTQANVDAGQVANTATATGQDPGANDVTDTDAKTVPLPAGAQLVLTKMGILDDAVAAPPGVANAGDEITYGFSVQNTGNVTVTSIDVTDPLLPALVCAIGTLAPGATAVCVATNNVYTLTQANVDAGQVANTATATGQDPGANDVTDTDAKMVPLPAAPQLTLTKTGTLNAAVVAPPLVANAGDTISYAFSVQNTGNVTVTSIEVTDLLLPALDCTIAALAPGDTTTCTATGNVYTVLQADVDTGEVANTAMATGEAPDTSPVTDDGTETVPLSAAAELTLTKEGLLDDTVAAPPGVANAGDEITYTFTVQNTGNVTVTSIEVTDLLLPALDCTIAALAPGDTTTCTATGNVYTVLQADVDTGEVANAAMATGEAPDTSPVTDDGTETVPLSAAAELTLTKEGLLDDTVAAPPGVANAGDEITYTFTVQNTGNVTVTSIEVTDLLLPALDCTIAALAPGDTTTCTATGNVYTVLQADVDTGEVANTAMATGEAPDTSPVTDDGTETVPLSAAAELTLTKEGLLDDTVAAPPGVANAGDEITYTFTVQNTGNVTVTSIDVTDPLLPALDCTIAALAPGDTTTCTATGNVYTVLQADVDAGEVANTAMATGEAPDTSPVTVDGAETVTF